MANGDLADTAGLAVFASSQDRKLGYDNDNIRGDELAAHMLTGTHTMPQIIGLAAALLAKQDALGFAPVQQGGGSGMASNKIYVGWSGSEMLMQVDAVPQGAVRFTGNGQFASVPIYTPHGRANPATSSYISAYINSDGRIAGGASSRRFKQDIASWSPDLQAVLALQLVTFRYIAEVEREGEQAAVEVGLIAEDLVELGLSWLVYFDDRGRAQGIHYERIALALLPVIQDLHARVTALEEKAAS